MQSAGNHVRPLNIRSSSRHFPCPILMNRRKPFVLLARTGAWHVRLLLFVLTMLPTGALAQATIGEMRRQATRSELERAAKAAESASLQAPDDKTREKLRADAAAIRMRLDNGDFIPGDRINLIVAGDSALTDTFTVRGDRMLPLPNIPPISLHGVLDSELESHLTKELLRYIKTVQLDATPLVRISLLGFPQSNFYTVPVDQSITDVIAAAGGWGSVTAVAPDKAVVRRAGKVIMDSKATAEAVRQGKTVGDMAMRDGDELYVPDRQSSGINWQKIATGVGAVSSLFWIIRYGR
jgi:hypothetical protein